MAGGVVRPLSQPHRPLAEAVSETDQGLETGEGLETGCLATGAVTLASRKQTQKTNGAGELLLQVAALLPHPAIIPAHGIGSQMSHIVFHIFHFQD